jgi:hypothetical protein
MAKWGRRSSRGHPGKNQTFHWIATRFALAMTNKQLPRKNYTLLSLNPIRETPKSTQYKKPMEWG